MRKVADHGQYSTIFTVDGKKAIKFYKHSSSTSVSDDLLNESAMLSMFKSPRVIKPTSVKYVRGQGTIEMPLLHGDFTELCYRLGMRNDVGMVFKYGRLMAHCLLDVHNQGIIHQDVKLCNFLYDRINDSVVICDFGISTVHSLMYTINGYTYSDVYRAPECWQSPVGLPSFKSDIWALGMCFWLMYSGDRLPQGEESILLFERDVSNNPAHWFWTSMGAKYPSMKGRTVPSKLTRVVDPKLRDLLFHMLDVSPETRYDIKQVLEHPFFNERVELKTMSQIAADRTSVLRFKATSERYSEFCCEVKKHLIEGVWNSFSNEVMSNERSVLYMCWTMAVVDQLVGLSPDYDKACPIYTAATVSKMMWKLTGVEHTIGRQPHLHAFWKTVKAEDEFNCLRTCGFNAYYKTLAETFYSQNGAPGTLLISNILVHVAASSLVHHYDISQLLYLINYSCSICYEIPDDFQDLHLKQYSMLSDACAAQYSYKYVIRSNRRTVTFRLGTALQLTTIMSAHTLV